MAVLRVLDVSIQKRFFGENGKGTPFVVPSGPVKARAFAPEAALDLTFQAPAGFTIVFGASGAGKTSLLNCIAGLTRPESGRIAIGDRVLLDADRHISTPVSERKVGYVFQDLALFPHLTAEQNIAYGLAKLGGSEQHGRTQAILESLKIAHLRQRKCAILRDSRIACVRPCCSLPPNFASP